MLSCAGRPDIGLPPALISVNIPAPTAVECDNYKLGSRHEREESGVSSIWMVRAGRASENVEAFIEHGIVALGGRLLGPLAPSISKAELMRLREARYPSEKEGSRASWVSQLMRFLGEIKSGDAVVTSDRNRRLYFLGRMNSGYEWAPGLIEDKPHVRRVKWTHQVPRDVLSTSTRNTLGSTLTLFRLSTDVESDLHAHQEPIGSLTGGVPSEAMLPIEGSVEDGESIREEMIDKADEFIEDAISRLDWSQMQELVAGILRSMGYRTKVSPAGGDRGIDIFASPDGLGLQEPRIFVEVKHRDTTPMNGEKVRALLGGRKAGDKCLYVSTGGFTKDARFEAERATVPTTLVNLQELRKLLVESYEVLDAETRALIPLKRLYWPLR